MADQLIYSRLGAWAREFSQILRQAIREAEGLPPGWVWQERFVDYFRRYELFADQLRDLGREPPRKAQIDYAIGVIEFFPHPDSGQEMIAYQVARLKEWAKEFNAWLGSSLK